MSETEARKIIAVMMVSFPNYKPVDIDLTATTWADMLSEYTYEQVNAALKAYILSDNSGFAPSVGQIVDKIHTLTRPKELNEMEAWSLVSKALKNGYYGAEEEFAKLPPIVQKAVGQPSQLRAWASDEEYNESVVSSNFMRSYRMELTQAQQISKLPQGMQEAISKVNENRGIEIRPYVAIEDKPIEYNGVPMPDEQRQRFEKMKEKWA